MEIGRAAAGHWSWHELERKTIWTF